MSFFKDIFNNKGLIMKLSRNDFMTKYASSQLGIFWAFVQPLLTILIYWFVFQIGFRVVPLDNVPYILWLMCGLIPWFFFSEGLQNATNSLIEYSYLVKKVVFKISIVPLIKIVSSFYIHIFFVILLFYVLFFYGFEPSIYNIQLIYYISCLLFLLVGLAYITSSIVIFFRDLSQIISMVLQFGVWLTPILWQPTMFSAKFQLIIKGNPLYYIVEGFRDSLFGHIWFWEKPNQTMFFWGLSTFFLIFGFIIYKRLKPHFADAL